MSHQKPQQNLSAGNEKDIIRRRWHLWDIHINKKLGNPNELLLLWCEKVKQDSETLSEGLPFWCAQQYCETALISKAILLS